MSETLDRIRWLAALEHPTLHEDVEFVGLVLGPVTASPDMFRNLANELRRGGSNRAARAETPILSDF